MQYRINEPCYSKVILGKLRKSHFNDMGEYINVTYNKTDPSRNVEIKKFPKKNKLYLIILKPDMKIASDLSLHLHRERERSVIFGDKPLFVLYINFNTHIWCIYLIMILKPVGYEVQGFWHLRQCLRLPLWELLFPYDAQLRTTAALQVRAKHWEREWIKGKMPGKKWEVS